MRIKNLLARRMMLAADNRKSEEVVRTAMSTIALAASVAVGVAGSNSFASAATLAGATIHGYYSYPTQNSLYEDFGTFTAPGGGTGYNGLYDYTVTSDKIIITVEVNGTSWTPAGFNGLNFVDISGDPDITGVTLDPSTTSSGTSISDASFTSDSVSLNFEGETWKAGQSAVFDLAFGVPEPASWALMLVGFGGLGLTLRSARRRAAVVIG